MLLPIRTDESGKAKFHQIENRICDHQLLFISCANFEEMEHFAPRRTEKNGIAA